MSLLKLLATGKSWVGMQDTNSRYRMRTAQPAAEIHLGQESIRAGVPRRIRPARAARACFGQIGNWLAL